MVIVKIGNKIIDTEYYSKKFGIVEMIITCVEPSPVKETSKYLRELNRIKREKDKNI
jgi:hypothetical protein